VNKVYKTRLSCSSIFNISNRSNSLESNKEIKVEQEDLGVFISTLVII
jgi:hypothetical protein